MTGAAIISTLSFCLALFSPFIPPTFSSPSPLTLHFLSFFPLFPSLSSPPPSRLLASEISEEVIPGLRPPSPHATLPTTAKGGPMAVKSFKGIDDWELAPEHRVLGECRTLSKEALIMSV